ncbi:MarR family winged helix-turn-helix transcriptional regulator [Microbacterium enclense]|uniref:MarR family winged helix-turn-helix transcriptional regulator n=1 Tax=Microbacterium enclense TaxID=993073 RepID=UPI0034322B4A
MNTPNDPRALAHRLTTVGHALHHRLFAQLHDSGIHPKTLLLLRAVDGRVDAPWVADRLDRGGKRVTALAERGWIARTDDAWSLTADGRALLDRADAERSALLADVPEEQLANLTTALDALANALGIDDDESADRPARGFRVDLGAGPRGFGPGARRAFGPNEHRGFRVGERPGPRRPFEPADPGAAPDARPQGHGERGESHGHGPHGESHRHGEHRHGHGEHHGERGESASHGEHRHGRGAHGCGGEHRRHRREERAYERGFDAGFRRGREAGAPPAAQD